MAKQIARRSIRRLRCRSPRGQRQERSIGGSENAGSGSAGCVGRTDGNDGSTLLIFARQAGKPRVEAGGWFVISRANGRTNGGLGKGFVGSFTSNDPTGLL